MSNIDSHNCAPEVVGSVVTKVAGGLIGGVLIDSLRKSFTSSSLVHRGDHYMDQSRVLLQNHLQLIELREQNTIHRKYENLRATKRQLDSHGGSKFQKFLKARDYKRTSKETFVIIKEASDRGLDDHLMNQIVRATRLPEGSVLSNPFSDSNAVSNISQVSVNDLDRVEVSTYQEDTTTGGAVVLGLVADDESVQHIVATFSTEAFSGDRTDSGASQSMAPEVPAALSLHKEDGSSPRFIAAVPLPDPSDETADEQAEASTLNSFEISEVMTSEGKRPNKVMRASVPPVDSDTYTRSFPSGSCRL